MAIDSMASQTVLSLVQRVLAYSGADPTETSPQPRQPPQQSPPSLQQCWLQVDTLVSAATSLKMLGHYLRAVLVHHLKQRYYKHGQLARQWLGIKSPADVAAYPAFFEFVREHCPAIAAATAESVPRRR